MDFSNSGGTVVQQPTQSYNNFPIPTPMPSNPTEDFFTFRINGGDILEEISHQLRGDVAKILEDGSVVYENRFIPMMNEEGINKMLYIIYTNGINKNTLLGNFSKEEIYFKCRMLKKKLSLLIFKRYADYGITKEMRSLIVQTAINAVHSGLSRSEGGREAEQLSTAHQRHDIFQHNEEIGGNNGGFGFNPGNWFKKKTA